MRRLLLAALLAPLVSLAASATEVARSPTSEIQALLARQNELTQRVAGIYLMRGMLESPQVGNEDLRRARADMNANLAVLRISLDGEPAAQDTLERMSVQVDWLSAAVDDDGIRNYALLVADAAAAVHGETQHLASLPHVRAGG